MTRPFGTLEVFRRLRRAIGYTRPGVPPVSQRISAIYFLRCMVHFSHVRDWFCDEQNPALHEALTQRPSLIGCAWRPYLHDTWPAARKLDTIRDHYRLLSHELAFLRFDATADLTLARFGDDLSLRLDKAPWFEHEGELTLNLFDGPLRLYSLVFVLGQCSGRRTAYIGALQGVCSADALEIYRTLTRRMHGLRPRDLLVASFRQLCTALDVSRILAVTDAASVSRSAYFKTRDKVLASYDQAWSENGGRAVTGGFFELDPAITPREAGEIPPRKRALYRRRYEMLEDFGRQIQACVHQFHAEARCKTAPGTSPPRALRPTPEIAR